MDDQEQYDLLIRVDTKLKLFEESLKAIEARLFEPRFCDTHAEKIKTLEKITWGALLAAIAAMIKSFWSVFVK